jgi:hypothetical protein
MEGAVPELGLHHVLRPADRRLALHGLLVVVDGQPGERLPAEREQEDQCEGSTRCRAGTETSAHRPISAIRNMYAKPPTTATIHPLNTARMTPFLPSG